MLGTLHGVTCVDTGTLILDIDPCVQTDLGHDTVIKQIGFPSTIPKRALRLRQAAV